MAEEPSVADDPAHPGSARHAATGDGAETAPVEEPGGVQDWSAPAAPAEEDDPFFRQ